MDRFIGVMQKNFALAGDSGFRGRAARQLKGGVSTGNDDGIRRARSRTVFGICTREGGAGSELVGNFVEFVSDLVGQRLSRSDSSEDKNQKQEDILDIIHVLLVQKSVQPLPDTDHLILPSVDRVWRGWGFHERCVNVD